jgi:phage gp36-like protein
MGNYATTAELKARFEDDIEVAHLTNTASTGVPDETVLAEVVNHAEGQLDSHIGMRYKIPVDVSSDTVLAAMLKSATLDVAVYHLLARGDVMPQAKIDARKAVVDWLKEIAKGEAILPSAATIDSTQSRDPIVSWGTAGTGDTSNRLFSRATQENL